MWELRISVRLKYLKKRLHQTKFGVKNEKHNKKNETKAKADEEAERKGDEEVIIGVIENS